MRNGRMREKMIKQAPVLQNHLWPPVAPFAGYSAEISKFLHAGLSEKKAFLREEEEKAWQDQGEFFNRMLAEIYAYIYGYEDSPCYLTTQPDLEIAIQSAKILIEEIYLNHWLPVSDLPDLATADDAYAYLESYVETNVGVGHELYIYLRDEASPEAIKEFLRLEVCRNEVVDDEIAMMVCGLQGNLKRMAAANLWDECGNGDLVGFHTYWLRRLLEHMGDWQSLLAYRQTIKPWFASITSNTFNALLTRPSHKYRAYGCFTTTEAWVEPHFDKLLKGINRVGLSHPDVCVYFATHCKIDPFHTRELLDGIKDQVPYLKLPEMLGIVRGSHIAVAAAESQYRLVKEHLHAIDAENAL